MVGRHVDGQLHAVAGSRSSLRHNAKCQATRTTLALGHLGATPQSIRANSAPTLKESDYTYGECRHGCVGIADPRPQQTHLSLTSRCADRYATLLASRDIEYGSTAMTCWLDREILEA